MKGRSALTLAVVVGALGFTAGRVFCQDKKEMSEEEKMKAWMEMAAPAEQHKKLAATAGTWDADVSMWMKGKPDPIKSKGVTTYESMLNGLYLSSTHKGDMGGMPFEGRQIDGYSKEKKKYFAFWCDSMGTTPMMFWGDADASGKTITMDADPYDCGPEGMMTARVKITHDDADHTSFEFWAKTGDDKEYKKQMEIKYTRKK